MIQDSTETQRFAVSIEAFRVGLLSLNKMGWTFGSPKIQFGSGSPSSNPLKFIANLCHDNIKIIQSCNGLFLCYPEIVLNSIIQVSDVRRVTTPLYHYVLNPTTNQFTKLVPPAAAAATTTTEPRIFGCALAFDPSKSPHYKVVFLWFRDDPSPYGWCSYHNIEIYSSETKSWSLVNSSFETQGHISYQDGVYCNGAVHWVGRICEMAYYHLEEERVGLVDGLPRLLEMGRDYSGWFVKYNVDLDLLCTAYPRYKVFCVLFLAKGENEAESSSLLLHAPGKVFSYNVKSNTFKSFDLTPQAGVGQRSNFRYIESLACV
ncbi:hypothetical protein ACLB2K_057725 [Fragaria x ananassa]